MRFLRHVLVLSTFGSFGLAGACGDSGDESTFSPGGGGDDAGASSGSSGGFGGDSGGSGDGGGAGDGGGPQAGTLVAIVRDFKQYDPKDSSTNPDFENVPTSAESGKPKGYGGPWTEATAKYFTPADFAVDIVMPDLGADGTPVYDSAAKILTFTGRTVTTHGKDAFASWYHDVPGVNVVRKVPLELTKGANGVYSYDSAVSGLPEDPKDPSSEKGFWPIDDGSAFATKADGFGNQGRPHNYHFTVELRTKFTYRGTESFKFSGDDDVFVFINKKLVINIGGIHGRLEKEVHLPDIAGEIGLVVGKEYPLDFFQAERHVTQSNLRIDTTIDLVPSVVH